MVLIILALFAVLVILSAMKVSGECSRQEEEMEWRKENQ